MAVVLLNLSLVTASALEDKSEFIEGSKWLQSFNDEKDLIRRSIL